MDNNWRLGLIGCGNMGSALVSGVTQSSVIDADRVWVFDVDKNKTALIRDRKPVHIADSNADLLDKADTIVLAVKPQVMQNVLEEIRPYANPQHLFISVAAGVPIRMYERFLGPEIRIVRTMPNIPCLISRGATAVTADSTTSGAGLWTFTGVSPPTAMAETRRSPGCMWVRTV